MTISPTAGSTRIHHHFPLPGCAKKVRSLRKHRATKSRKSFTKNAQFLRNGRQLTRATTGLTQAPKVAPWRKLGGEKVVLRLSCMTFPNTPLGASRRGRKRRRDDTQPDLPFEAGTLGQEETLQVPDQAVKGVQPSQPTPRPSSKAAKVTAADSAYERHKKRLAQRNKVRFAFEVPQTIRDRITAYARTEDLSNGQAATKLLKDRLKQIDRQQRRQPQE